MLSFTQQKDDALATYLSLGLRLGYTQPLLTTRTWEKTSSEFKADLPEFEGPAAPLAGVYAGLEVQFRFAMEAAR
jgi:hypothetical protein